MQNVPLNTEVVLPIHGVEVTIMDASLQLNSQAGSIVVTLTNSQSLALREELSKFDGFKLDSKEDPVILAAIQGATGRSRLCARAYSGLEMPDSQIGDMRLSMFGDRLIFQKGEKQTFLQLNSQQSRCTHVQIEDLRELPSLSTEFFSATER